MANNNRPTYGPSGWITWSYFLLGFISFLIIGHKAKNRMWTYCGLGYAFLFTFWMLGGGSETKETAPELHEMATTVALFYWIGSIIHCHMVKKEYWMRLQVLQEEQDSGQELEEMRMKIRQERGLGTSNATTSKADNYRRATPTPRKPATSKPAPTPDVSTSGPLHREQPPQASQPSQAPTAPVDINTCTVAEMAALPGVSLVMAKKADNYRKQKGGFASAQEFFNVVELKPHFVVQVEGLVICNPPQPDDSPDTQPVGRRLDL